jgi:hypothetical protein
VGGGTRIRKVLLYFSLSIDHYVLLGEAFEIDPMAPTVEGEIEAIVHQPFVHHPLAHTGFIQKIDRTPLKKSGPNTPLDVFPGLTLEHDGLNAVAM